MTNVPDVASRLRATAERFGDNVALRWRQHTLTYAELDARVSAAAAALQHLGVGRGDRVAILLGNVPAFVEAYFATQRAGAVAVPLNPELAGPEVAHALRDAGARVCVTGTVLAGTVCGLAPEVELLSHVLVAGTVDALPQAPPPVEVVGWRALLEAGHPLEEIERHRDDLAAIVYTSGTTGQARGAMLTRGNLLANQEQSLAGRFQITADDVVLLVLPLSHIYAMNVGIGTCVRVGATMLLAERFDPVASLQAIVEHRVSIILGAPQMYIAWLNTPDTQDYDLSHVRLAISGAAPLPDWVFRRFAHEFGITIEEGYGLTEAAPSVTSNSMAPRPRPGSVGLPLPDLELRLVDAAGRDVSQGDPGEIWVKGPNVFAGYWQDPEATAAALTADGWLRTGDVAVRDGDGFVYLVDRRQDLIIVSGFNVYPREVERVLLQHERVAACAVVGIPHPYTGESVRAFVVSVAGSEVSVDELDAFCRDRLARYKCPRTIDLVSSLPQTASGKIRRVDLR